MALLPPVDRTGDSAECRSIRRPSTAVVAIYIYNMISKEQFLLIGGRISFAFATDFLASHPSIPAVLRNKYFNELQNVEASSPYCR